MKVIELLNLISRDRELPNKIKYNGYIFEYDINHKRYEAYFDEQIWVLQDFISIDDDLNNEVEIIDDEEPQEHKIPKKLDQTLNRLDMNEDYYRYIMENRFKINEILDYLNLEE